MAATITYTFPWPMLVRISARRHDQYPIDLKAIVSNTSRPVCPVVLQMELSRQMNQREEIRSLRCVVVRLTAKPCVYIYIISMHM